MRSLTMPLSPPVHLLTIDGMPKLMAGGDPQHARMLLGPHFVGPSADLAPVTLTFSGDMHHPDLVVTVSNLQVMFHNTGSNYEPMR
ncbi:hypothetical protein [Ktedonobacter robiniae]|uniref:Uncharacterized protein n=1 Tax=Ktedonobacter robiniae TaxID=2778365 RepID=A0ABQ3UT93_9CHLR|nr:hypothetical protein [Ktedonobacter robiniae]GHO55906.1 hypothetical protein KSB_43810 [Ktedonobacter robiniae]